jgi:uncharacterized protein (TIGR02300 family)
VLRAIVLLRLRRRLRPLGPLNTSAILLLLSLLEGAPTSRAADMRPFWRDWLRSPVRISLLTEPPRNAKETGLNRVPKDREAVTKPELGTKRLCARCGARFYDLNQVPITCPKCGALGNGVQGKSRWRSDARAPVRAVEPLVPETQEAEFVSLEDADAQAQGKKEPGEDIEAGDEVELDHERVGDDAFMEDSEQEDTDVIEILGGDIEKEEES